MENPAQSSDLTNRGYSGPATTAVQQEWLDVSFRALRRELRRINVDLETAIDPADTDAVLSVVDVVVSAALRVLRNPEGVDQESGSIDDYTESIKRRDATEDIYFTAAELRRFRPVDEVSGSWAGSVKYL